jgi:hypothetical protein
LAVAEPLHADQPMTGSSPIVLAEGENFCLVRRLQETTSELLLRIVLRGQKTTRHLMIRRSYVPVLAHTGEFAAAPKAGPQLRVDPKEGSGLG